ncbi:hypothetical protein [Nocardia sp. NPDC052566]|uniref:hypothetical protein n=1 Tax=Nocardia sp. NPDC052566 TaxID=3364330 RepID=UPI0037CA582F
MDSTTVRCALCDNETRFHNSNIYDKHDTTQGEHCRASDGTRSEAIRMRREFRSTDDPNARLDVHDNSDSIGIRTLLTGTDFTLDSWIHLDGPDVRRLIAELMSIADERGM